MAGPWRSREFCSDIDDAFTCLWCKCGRVDETEEVGSTYSNIGDNGSSIGMTNQDCSASERCKRLSCYINVIL